MHAEGTYFSGIVDALYSAGGWTITVDGEISDFYVADDWGDASWSSILADIVEDNGLCESVNPITHTIAVYPCP